MRARTFLAVNAVAAMAWSVTFSTVGNLFGHEFEAWIGRLHPHGRKLWWIIGALVAAGLILGAIHWLTSRRRN